MSWKFHLHSFFKLFLRDVIVKMLWNSWYFLVIFCMRSSPTLPLTPSFFFFEIKGAKVVHKSCKFHLHLTCSSWLFNLQMFSYLQKAGVKPPFNPTFFSSGRIKIIRESLPCLPKLHPSGAQIKKTFSNEIRFSSVIQEVKRAQRILIDLKWAGNNLNQVKVF